MKKIHIGVLGLQGDYDMHCKKLNLLPNVSTSVIKYPEELNSCDGLVLPGGESTTVGKLMERYGLDTAIKSRVSDGMAIMGTCTGMILLASKIENSKQQRLGLIDAAVRRNAFGRQTDSFESAPA